MIDPAAEPAFERTAPGRLSVDGRRGFGQVVGMRMVEALRPLVVECGIAMASGRHLGHTGRVGAYPEALARIGTRRASRVCNGAPSGHWVAAFGGRDGRISTNPIAMAWPVEGSDPVVADFSTAVTAEGVVRVHRDQGQRGARWDAPRRGRAGRADDPAASTPTRAARSSRSAARSAIAARRLALFVEVLTTLLNGDRVARTDRARGPT